MDSAGGGQGHLVHLAAPAIRVGSVIRQRCAWCGALIDENDLDRIAYVDDGQGHPLIDDDGNPTTRWDGLVAVEQHGEHDALGMVTKWCVEATDGIPPDSCMALSVEVTR